MSPSLVRRCTWAIALAACHHEVESFRADRYEAIETPLPAGISGISVDEHEHLWAIPERQPVVAEIVLEASRPTVALHPLEGVPRDLDTEAIAYLGDGHFAIGAEAHDRPFAGVFLGTLRADGHIVVAPAYTFDSAMLGIELRRNNGVESVCGVGRQLLVGIESTGRTDTGARFAPIVRIGNGTSVVQRLHLTTETGKLSALACGAPHDGEIELLAIERDFGVTRILRATSRANEPEIEPTVLLDLWPLLRDRYAGKVNLEGIARLRDGRIVVVNDNEGAGLGGPTRLMLFTPR